MNLWSILEKTPGLYAVGAEWQRGMGEQFDPFRNYFQALRDPAQSYPCPHKCGCAHEVMVCGDHFLGLCRCQPPECDELVLTPEDVTVWQLNWKKLGRGLGHAFCLQTKIREFDLYGTMQIGFWASEVPVILTIQWQPHQFRLIIAELALRLQRPYILLGPTSAHLDAHCQELLAHAQSEYFPLERHVILTDHGSFQPTKAPGELFARFRPEPKEKLDEDEARRGFAILVKLHTIHPPTVITVLLMYC